MSTSSVIRILYIEDNKELADYIKAGLERQGKHLVKLAGNGAEGVVRFEENAIDVLVVDYDLPIYNGLEMISTLAARRSLPPTILVTDKVNGKITVQAIKLGVTDHLVKDTDAAVYLELLLLTISRVYIQKQLEQERKRLFATIQDSEDRYRRLVELAPSGIALCVAGKFAFINPAGLALLGLKNPDEAIGKLFADFVHPDDQSLIQQKLHTIKVGPTALQFGDRSIQLKKTGISIEIIGIPFIYHGKPTIQMIFQDVTDRKKTEAALRASEERFKTIADFTYDWEYWISPEGNYNYISPSCLRLTGYHPQEFISQPYLLEMITDPRDRDKLMDHLQKEKDINNIIGLDFRIITKNNQEVWLGHICQPVYNSAGRYLGRRASNRDISKRKQMEQALSRSVQRYKALFEQASDAIFLENERDEIVDVNHRACELLGYTREELLSKRVSDLQAPGFRGEPGSIIKNEVKKYNNSTFLTQDLHKDGTLIPVEVSINKVMDGNEDEGLVLAIVREVKERSGLDSAGDPPS